MHDVIIAVIALQFCGANSSRLDVLTVQYQEDIRITHGQIVVPIGGIPDSLISWDRT